jgi:flagellar secretion chaperone FliS
MNSAYKKYKESSVHSASREKLLLMLYEAAIKFTKKAMAAIDAKDIAERGLNIGKAFDIIIELNTTLNHKVAPELAQNLEQLYMFITDQYTKANVTGKKEHLEHALKILEVLYKGWVDAVEKLKREGKLSSST